MTVPLLGLMTAPGTGVAVQVVGFGMDGIEWDGIGGFSGVASGFGGLRVAPRS